MKERPILFSADMVRAILDSRKTQARSVVKPRDLEWMDKHQGLREPDNAIRCPFGVPGDRLWVRESFWGCDGAGMGDTPCVVYEDEWHGKNYRAAEIRPWAPKFGHIPSIHMPRHCSRIALEVTGVRVERLQEIDWEDAIAEGIRDPRRAAWRVDPVEGCVAKYRELWNSLNAERGHGWDTNPWVWVVEFKRIER